MVEASAQVLSNIHSYTAELERRGVPVERVILFGSHARGEVHSDIDLAVFSEAFGGADHAEFSGVLSAAKWNTDPMIEAIGFNPAALRNVSPVSLLHEIMSTGCVVYQRPQ